MVSTVQVMLDGSRTPRRLQLVYDMALLDVPAMTACLAEMRVRELISSCPEWSRDATPAMKAEAFHLGMILQEQVERTAGVAPMQSGD